MSYLKEHSILNHTLGKARKRRGHNTVSVREATSSSWVTMFLLMINAILFAMIINYVQLAQKGSTEEIYCTESLLTPCKVLAYSSKLPISDVIAAAEAVIADEDKQAYRKETVAFIEALSIYERSMESVLDYGMAEGDNSHSRIEKFLRYKAKAVLNIIGTEEV